MTHGRGEAMRAAWGCVLAIALMLGAGATVGVAIGVGVRLARWIGGP